MMVMMLMADYRHEDQHLYRHPVSLTDDGDDDDDHDDDDGEDDGDDDGDDDDGGEDDDGDDHVIIYSTSIYLFTIYSPSIHHII